MLTVWLSSEAQANPQRGGLLSSLFSAVGQVSQQAARPIISGSSNPSFRPNFDRIRNTVVGSLSKITNPSNNGDMYNIVEGQCNNRCNSPCSSLGKNCICRQDFNCLQNRYRPNNHNNFRPNNLRPNNFHINNHQSAQFNQFSVSRPTSSNSNLNRVTQCFYHEHQGYPGRHSHNCGNEPHGYHYHDYSGNTYVYANGRYHRT